MHDDARTNIQSESCADRGGFRGGHCVPRADRLGLRQYNFELLLLLGVSQGSNVADGNSVLGNSPHIRASLVAAGEPSWVFR
jgi:hypothetical protein